MRVVKLAHGYWGEQCARLLSTGSEAAAFCASRPRRSAVTNWDKVTARPVWYLSQRWRAGLTLYLDISDEVTDGFPDLLVYRLPHGEYSQRWRVEGSWLVGVHGMKDTEIHLYNKHLLSAFCEQNRQSLFPMELKVHRERVTITTFKQGLITYEYLGRKDHSL